MAQELFPWEKKAAELEARNEELRKKEAEFKRSQTAPRPSSPFASPSSRPSNWPSCFPLIRHDIDDLPEASPFKVLVVRSFLIWKLTAAVLFLNLLLVLVAFFTGHSSGSPVSLFQAAILTPILPMLAFFMGHYLLYTGASRQSQWLIGGSLLGIVLQMGLFGAMALGFVSGANGGIFSVLDLLRQRAWLLFLLASGSLALLAVCILLSLHLLKRVVQVLRVAEFHSGTVGNV
jgi:hypothetical protein